MNTKRVKIKLESGQIIDGVWHLYDDKEWLSDMMGNQVEGVIV